MKERFIFKQLKSSVTRHIHLIKWLIVFIFLLPTADMLWRFYTNELGANPIEEITHITGQWALRCLLITLAISPLRKLFNFNLLIKFRRVFGLLSFFYVSMHFAGYIVLDQWLDWVAIFEDIKERPYITIGFAAFILMIPLAITSTDAMQHRLQTLWVRLHRLIYLIAILAILHFWWLVKADLLEPIIYASILLLLLAYRVLQRFKSVI